MNPFEKELRKMFGADTAFSDPRFIGRTCFGRLSENTYARIDFITNGTYKHYEGLTVSIQDRQEGEIDHLTLLFSDLWGKKQVQNPNFPQGLTPYLWDYNGEVSWYAYQPTAADRQVVLDAVNGYLELFQEPEQSMDREPQGFNMEMM